MTEQASNEPTPGAEDPRIASLRRRVAAGESLTADERCFLESEGIKLDPDEDPAAEARGGKVGRGFWDEDSERDLI
jgi:hypothetical protein